MSPITATVVTRNVLYYFVAEIVKDLWFAPKGIFERTNISPHFASK